MADSQVKTLEAQSQSFARDVLSSLLANVLFASFLTGGIYVGYRKNWFRRRE